MVGAAGEAVTLPELVVRFTCPVIAYRENPGLAAE